ncbi:thioester domain-containing protein [uncultured Clostridium sp.]|uniref:thioester domain-containing protein n=1 Tax=uncultured Clostridium sp. TaxID=59620 RepID=UPI00258C4F30|nr:thioester domain-containing protein [uncultured Clostridium sp.]MDU1350109.1 thioester domain-containing protein [Clostridium argentinense]
MKKLKRFLSMCLLIFIFSCNIVNAQEAGREFISKKPNKESANVHFSYIKNGKRIREDTILIITSKEDKNLYAYCIDMYKKYPSYDGTSYNWGELSSEIDRKKLNKVFVNGFPVTSPETLSEKVGLDGDEYYSLEEAYAVTQLALWHYTEANRDIIKFSIEEDIPDERILKGVKYLINRAEENKEDSPIIFQYDKTTINKAAFEKDGFNYFGPIKVHGDDVETLEEININLLNQNGELVYENGETVNNTIILDREFYVKVPKSHKLSNIEININTNLISYFEQYYEPINTSVQDILVAEKIQTEFKDKMYINMLLPQTGGGISSKTIIEFGVLIIALGIITIKKR